MVKTPIVRMYVDENGHETLKGDLSGNDKRFLCLTGIIMMLKEHDRLTDAMNALKVKFFGSTDIILHRRELIAAEPPFECLKNEEFRDEFNNDFLRIVRSTEYWVVSVVIDKKALVDRYGILHAKDPYALALEDIMHRYQYWLQSYSRLCGHCYGDILIEARSKGEDRRTRATYIEIYNGRGYNRLQDATKYYSSGEIKLKPKSANIAGLQFVDLICHAARRYILTKYGLADNIKHSSYEQQIVEILVESKFRRLEDKIEGFGIRLFPS